MFAGEAVFPGEVHWGTRCPRFAVTSINNLVTIHESKSCITLPNGNSQNVWPTLIRAYTVGQKVHLNVVDGTH